MYLPSTVLTCVKRPVATRGPFHYESLPELGPLVGPSRESEGSDLQLLDVHGQDVRRRQGGSPPHVFPPHQTLIITLQEHLRRERFLHKVNRFLKGTENELAGA